ncbi:J domain-containing protein [Halobellus ordinarius]|uniref:J domain-containing protein n=1 Tax=Halobellus ordinarius TaxID=3075120 RepID=UPI002880A93F|nr:J domain-containing protein [Halobellus sp. ZY16]
MNSKTDRTAGAVDWPEFVDRTPPRERKRTSKYSVTKTQATKRLRRELLERVDADDWRLSTASPHRKRDGLPYADSNPDDPAAVVRWSKDGEQFAVACDHYTDVRDNIRTLGLYIEEKRKMSNRPVKTGQDEFATARLPPADDEEAIVASGEVKEPHEILGVDPEAPDAVVKGAFRELVKEAHADHGGDSKHSVSELKDARDALLGESR